MLLLRVRGVLEMWEQREGTQPPTLGCGPCAHHRGDSSVRAGHAERRLGRGTCPRAAGLGHTRVTAGHHGQAPQVSHGARRGWRPQSTWRADPFVSRDRALRLSLRKRRSERMRLLVRGGGVGVRALGAYRPPCTPRHVQLAVKSGKPQECHTGHTGARGGRRSQSCALQVHSGDHGQDTVTHGGGAGSPEGTCLAEEERGRHRGRWGRCLPAGLKPGTFLTFLCPCGRRRLKQTTRKRNIYVNVSPAVPSVSRPQRQPSPASAVPVSPPFSVSF